MDNNSHSSIVEIMASAGFEWLTIDMEHSAIDIASSRADYCYSGKWVRSTCSCK